jgi:hypothetical protein
MAERRPPMVSSNMTRALYKSLLLKEIRVMLLQRSAHFSGPKDLQLTSPQTKCRFFAQNPGSE